MTDWHKGYPPKEAPGRYWFVLGRKFTPGGMPKKTHHLRYWVPAPANIWWDESFQDFRIERHVTGEETLRGYEFQETQWAEMENAPDGWEDTKVEEDDG